MRSNNSQAVQRLLIMRQFPGLADAELSELSAVAESVIETFLPAGTRITHGSKLDSIHLVTEGRLESSGTNKRWEPRDTFGALEILAGRAAPGVVVAATDARTLQLTAPDFLELLEDNLSILSGARRAIAQQLLTARPVPVRNPSTPLAPPPWVLDGPRAQRLNVVERLIVLRQHELFSVGKIQALAALAQGCEELDLPAGMLVQERGDEPRGSLVVLEGMLRVSRPGYRDEIPAAGSELGLFDALAETPSTATIETLTPVSALRIPTAALFDVMEDHTDFALSVLGGLARAVLDAPEALAMSVEEATN